MPFHKKTIKSIKSTAKRTVRSVSRFGKRSSASASKFVARRAKRGARSVKRSFNKQVRGFTKSKSVRDVSSLAKRANPARGFRKVTQALKSTRKRTRSQARRRPR